ncbi:MAG: glycosyltransferase family 4 protein [Chloroflexota bacterium]
MRVLLIINATLDDGVEQAIAAGRLPRKDYLELRKALSADLIEMRTLEKRTSTRIARRLFGGLVAQALLARIVSSRYDVIFSDNETTGLVLAALLRLGRRRPRHVMIGHVLSRPMKQFLFRLLHLPATIDRVIVHSSRQEQAVRERLGFRAEQTAMVPFQSDADFWRPRDASVKRQICSAGREYRDYDTLLAAVEGLDVDVAIADGSPWSTHRHHIKPSPRVHIGSYDYAELRTLYAESLFVVVPLVDAENQAGITSILEAMAMGKAVVVSHTRGQSDVVRDRRSRDRSDLTRCTQPEWARDLGAGGMVSASHTGMYVRPGDVAELRRAIIYLLEHPERAAEMGMNGRQLVETVMDVHHFTERVAAIILGSDGVVESDPAARQLDTSQV